MTLNHEYVTVHNFKVDSLFTFDVPVFNNFLIFCIANNCTEIEDPEERIWTNPQGITIDAIRLIPSKDPKRNQLAESLFIRQNIDYDYMLEINELDNYDLSNLPVLINRR